MRSLASFACVVPVLVSLFVCSSPASAQCPSWESGFGANGLNGPVYAMTVFDDGTGPALYAGGSFTLAGGVAASSIAKWNGSTWSALGSGLAGDVTALAPHDDGSGPALYAGWFDQTSAWGGVAKWDGTSWVALGIGMDGDVLGLTTYDDGTGSALFVDGHFCNADGSSCEGFAKWNGSTWLPLFSPSWCPWGYGPQWTSGLTAFDDGTGPGLYVGTNVGSPVPPAEVWRLDGLGLTGYSAPGHVLALTGFDDGSGAVLYVAGDFPGCVVRLGGSSLGTGLGGSATASAMALSVFDDGSGPALYAGGDFTTAGSVAVNGVAKWNGSTWSALGSGVGGGSPTVYAMAGYFDGSGMALYAGGDFTTAGGVGSNDIAAWSGCSGSGAGTSFCFGDGTGIACPCANSGAVGHGCENSVATGGALLAGAGGASLALDTLLLSSSGELPTAPSIFLQGTTELANAVPFGDGLRCIGGALKRMYVKSAVGGTVAAPAAGDPSVSARSAAVGDVIQAGQARRYQVYYRDPNASFCASPSGGGFNVSQALRVLWAP